MNQKEFARLIGITQAYLSFIEAGNRPMTDDIAVKVSAKYKHTINEQLKELKAIIQSLEKLKRIRLR